MVYSGIGCVLAMPLILKFLITWNVQINQKLGILRYQYRFNV